MDSEFDNEAGLYVPKHIIIEPTIRPVRIVTDPMTDNDAPLRIQRRADCTLLIEREGEPAESMVPHLLADMTIPEQRAFLPLFGIDAPPEAVVADWRKHVGHLLWMRCLPHLIPPRARWE